MRTEATRLSGLVVFGRWVGIELTSNNCRQLYIPPGFAHGFCVTSDRADVLYKCMDYSLPGDEIAIRWNDQKLAIQWPISNPDRRLRVTWRNLSTQDAF
jgi:dTDP-4-dehydrorhamnose 3,5-epimerase